MAGSPALALVGPSTEDACFADHVVMVLKRGVDRAGFCTGVVLAPRVILTAAHCVAAIGDMRVHYRDDAGQPVLIEVDAVAVHPGYRADAAARRVVSIDLALVATRTPLDARFSAAALDDSGVVAVGTPLRIFGYGVAREGEGSSAGVLRSAALAGARAAFEDSALGRGPGRRRRGRLRGRFRRPDPVRRRPPGARHHGLVGRERRAVVAGRSPKARSSRRNAAGSTSVVKGWGL